MRHGGLVFAGMERQIKAGWSGGRAALVVRRCRSSFEVHHEARIGHQGDVGGEGQVALLEVEGQGSRQYANSRNTRSMSPCHSPWNSASLRSAGVSLASANSISGSRKRLSSVPWLLSRARRCRPATGLQRFQRQVAHRAAAERQLQCMPGYAIAQRIALGQAEVLDQVPRRIERGSS